MVCVPCFIIPVILFFWRWLIQPYFVKYIWNPWEKKDEQGNVIEKGKLLRDSDHCFISRVLFLIFRTRVYQKV
jgi:hypothetical protein